MDGYYLELILCIGFVVAAIAYCVHQLRSCAAEGRYDRLVGQRLLVAGGQQRRGQVAALLRGGFIPVAVHVAAASPDAEEHTCAVCLCDLEPGDLLRALACGHSYHTACVDPWLLESQTCPLCKDNVVVRAQLGAVATITTV
jgi:hypothetical protein